MREKESLIMSGTAHIQQTEMFESLASCFAFRCSASLNIQSYPFVLEQVKKREHKNPDQVDKVPEET
jgi:hypothetical protein